MTVLTAAAYLVLFVQIVFFIIGIVDSVRWRNAGYPLNRPPGPWMMIAGILGPVVLFLLFINRL